MTVTNDTSSVTHNGNGVTTTWPYTFHIPDADAANVGVFDTETNVLTTLAPALYEITGLNDEAGGSVEYPLPFTTDPISATERLVIWREVPFTQDLELTNQSPYFPTVLEDQLDLIVYQIQQLAEETDRAIKVTLGSNLTPDEFVEDLQAGAAEAQASATAAAASATAASASESAAATSEANAAASETAAEAAATTAAADAVTAVGLPADPTALHYLRRNAGDTAYEELDAGEVADDLTAVRYGTAQALTLAQQVQARTNIGANLLGGFRNKLINGLGTINQRGYSSGEATTGANQYTLDRWRVVTSGQSLSWTESENVRTMTAPAGGVEQVIEGESVLSGNHVLNWTGTATATVDGVARTKGEVFTLTGGTDVTVRFIGGTFSKPQLEEGSSPTQFEVRHIQQELALCQRYCEQPAESAYYLLKGRESDRQRLLTYPFAVPKRVVPSLALIGTVSGSVATITVASYGDHFTASATAITDNENNGFLSFLADAEF